MEIGDWIGRRVISAHTGRGGETVILLDDGSTWRVVAAGSVEPKRYAALAEVGADGIVRPAALNPE